MPLRQSLLSFGALRGSEARSSSTETLNRRPSLARIASQQSKETGDAVKGATPEPLLQLPTPSESVTDLSSQNTDYMNIKTAPKGRGRRVTKGLGKRRSEDCLLTDQENEEAQMRTVSGETLVTEASMSQTSSIEQAVVGLNLPWIRIEISGNPHKPELVAAKDYEEDETRKSVDTLVAIVEYPKLHQSSPEAEEEKRAKAAVQKQKKEENKRKLEERWKAADDKATRRSSRASVLSVAGDVVSNLAATVLGKRKSRTEDPKTARRPVSALEPQSSSHVTSDMSSKRRRLSESDATSVAQVVRDIKSRQAKDKKWLLSGLYAGQPSTFNPLLHNSKTKRKSLTALAELPTANKVLPLPMFAGERLLKTGRDFKLPFDVFCPLPPGQPKPDEWRKSNRNTFVGDAQAEWRTSKFQEHSTCMCIEETGCDDDCLNRTMYYECDDRNCNLKSDQCTNRAFADLGARTRKGGKYNIGVEVIKTVDRGHGVRSNRMFAPNQIIVEYSGEILTQEECEKRMRTIYKDNMCYYLMLFDQNMIIDATTKGSIARFVNHSCAPNCRMEKWTVGGQPRMALFAGDRGIMTGEELTYDYNFDPYSQKNVQECRCGEPECRGVLGPKPQKALKRDEASKDENQSKSIKRKVLDVVEESAGRLKKRKKVEIKAVVYDRKESSSRSTPRKPSEVRVLKKRGRKPKSPARVTSGLQRRPSKVKRVLEGTKANAASMSRSNSRRNVSSSSASQALLETDTDVRQVRRSQSLKERVGSLKRRVVRTVKGGQGARTRSPRTIRGINS